MDAAEKIFDISFHANGQTYKGWVNPSGKRNDAGWPSSFHVVLNEVSFGYLSLNNNKWTVDEDRPAELVEAAGNEIAKRYK